ncbi:hypothetical protein SAMN03159341_112129 [Paenibacillus sp. 1_12]|nr:hypothetical protein SAMN03159341_112129 [Paenibacillus sp. 1_12]
MKMKKSFLDFNKLSKDKTRTFLLSVSISSTVILVVFVIYVFLTVLLKK